MADIGARKSLKRRSFLMGAGAIGAGSLASPFVWTSAAHAANNELLVRTPGGSYDDTRNIHVYEPFKKLTGMTVVPVAATAARMLGMHKAGEMDLDLVDTGDDVLLNLQAEGALAEVDYSKFTHTDPNDIEEGVRRSHFTGSFNYAMVMAYNTDKFSAEKAPKSWADFWNIEAFPGPRTMPDIATGNVDLEFALLADGVKPEDLYPLDVERAFAAMSRVRSAVTKFWDTGALSGQMLADQEVYLASLWSTRAAVAVDNGAPVALQWNDNAVLGQAIGLTAASDKQEAALAFIDFNASPAVQSAWFQDYKASPVNKKSYKDTPKELLDPETNAPFTASRGFTRNIDWWAENRAAVNRRWSSWIAE